MVRRIILTHDQKQAKIASIHSKTLRLNNKHLCLLEMIATILTTTQDQFALLSVNSAIQDPNNILARLAVQLSDDADQ